MLLYVTNHCKDDPRRRILMPLESTKLFSGTPILIAQLVENGSARARTYVYVRTYVARLLQGAQRMHEPLSKF